MHVHIPANGENVPTWQPNNVQLEPPPQAFKEKGKPATSCTCIIFAYFFHKIHRFFENTKKGAKNYKVLLRITERGAKLLCNVIILLIDILIPEILGMVRTCNYYKA